jgi:RimJ/RimL family protein N-acetyltransferase
MMFARTERLLLRPSWPEDAAELHQAIADEGIVRNLARAPWPYAVDDAAQFVAQAHDALYPAFLLMLRTHGAPRIIGACGIGNYDGSAELGYWIMRPYWGLGFATEASRAVVHIALRQSNGRGEAMTCALYEKALDGAGTEPRARLVPPAFSMREQMERLQAA